MPDKVKEALIDLLGKTYQAILVGFVVTPFVIGKFSQVLIAAGLFLSAIIIVSVVIISYSIKGG